MPNTKFTPGAVVTVGDLEVGNTIFLRERRSFGLPQPIAPAVVTAVEPTATGRVLVHAHPAHSTEAATRSLGQLPASREFRLAVAVPEE